MPRADSALSRHLSGSSAQAHAGHASVIPQHFNLLPGDALRPAGAQGFHHRLLGRESRREPLATLHAAGLGVGSLGRREASLGKPFAMIVQHRLNAGDGNQIDAVSDDGHRCIVPKARSAEPSPRRPYDVPMSTAKQHEDRAAELARKQPVRCAVLTISDTRTLADDAGGRLIVDHVERAGHVVADRRIVPDEPAIIRQWLESWLRDSSVQAVLTTGGTGIAKRDGTIDVVRQLLTIELEGFGELFRMLSYHEVQAAAMMSRAVGGLVIRELTNGGDTLVFCMPGSPNAVELAMSKLIAPQLAHLVWERKR